MWLHEPVACACVTAILGVISMICVLALRHGIIGGNGALFHLAL
jgi:hypothetical protein